MLLTGDTELCLKDMEAWGKRIDKGPHCAQGPGGPGREGHSGGSASACKQAGRGHASAAAGTVPPRIGAESRFVLADPEARFYVATCGEAARDLDSDAHAAALLRSCLPRKARPWCASAPGPRPRSPRWNPRTGPRFWKTLGLKRAFRPCATAYQILDLITFFTLGRARVPCLDRERGPRAASRGRDPTPTSERGFIKAEVVRWEDLVKLGSEAPAAITPSWPWKAKDYVVRDGDVIHFKFNV